MRRSDLVQPAARSAGRGRSPQSSPPATRGSARRAAAADGLISRTSVFGVVVARESVTSPPARVTRVREEVAMRRAGLVSLSVGVILAIGGMWGCADSPASGTLGPATAGDPRATAAVDPLSTTKLTVCHVGGSADNPTFTPIALSASGALAHIAADGSPRIGHELDYYATARTPCPPPSTPGTLKVCKTAATDWGSGAFVSGPDGYPFTFTVAGQQYTVPSASCVDAGEFRVGTRVDIQETLLTGASVTSITFDPVGAGTGTPPSAAASLIIGIGETTVTFANLLPHAEVWFCPVTSPGVTATSFNVFMLS